MALGNQIKVLTVKFDTEIKHSEIALFRGAIINSMGNEADVLFHNHKDEEGFRYSYPLIQYKRIGGKATIVCIGMGTECIGQFLAIQQTEAVLGDRRIQLDLESVRPQNVLMQTWQSTFDYRLQHWLPLNSENYRLYQETDSLTERIKILERILKGNLLSMCKGLGIYLEEELTVSITRQSDPRLVRVKGIRMMSFDVDFRSNLSLPNGVGVGKNVSLGYGTVFRNKITKHNNK